MQNRNHTVVLALGVFLLILVITLVFLSLYEMVLIIISDVVLCGLGFGMAKMLPRSGRARWVLVAWIIMGLCAIYGIKFLRLRGYKWASMPATAYLFGYSLGRLSSHQSSVESPEPVQDSASGNVIGSDES